MKKLVLIAFFLIVAITLSAQTPLAFKYQAAARDNSGNVLANKNVTMRISIIQGTISGTTIYSELHAKTTNSMGLIDLEIGKGSSPSGTFSTINWGSDNYFIKVEMDPLGGIAFQTLGTSQLLSVPYALYAKTAATFNETDPIFNNSASRNISSSNISNWNTAYNWGNHAGLYHPVSWMPSWNSITSKPAFSTVANTGNYNDLLNKPNFVNSQWTNYNDTTIYYDNGRVGIGTTRPMANLHVAGSFRVGGLLIKEAGELHGITSSTGSSTLVPYPTGLNKDNIKILSCQIYYSNASWIELGRKIDCTLTNSGMLIQYPEEIAYQGRRYNLLYIRTN